MPTPNDIAAAAERRRQWRAWTRGDAGAVNPYWTPNGPGESIPRDASTLADAYLAEQRDRDLTFAVNQMAAIERAVRGEDAFGAVWPDWVYECRAALKHIGDHPPPWLLDLMQILGWQGGTVHQALNAVRRLVEAEKDRTKMQRSN